jgi:3-deoxy-7-phosphoheptulonate synthase
MEAYKQVTRKSHPHDTVVQVSGVSIGDGSFTVIAGPCAVESREQLFATAQAVREAGATVLRGDAFKPRTSPYAFQGLKEEGLQLLAEAREAFDMPFVAEVLEPGDVELVASYADIIRVGTRNMSNYSLLQELGRSDKAVMLKRGFTATIDDWLTAAEYVYNEGNHNIILVERGIRTFETATRNTLDISAVPVVKQRSHLPVLVDPSHSGGHKYLVGPLAKAGLVVGAAGMMVDVHPNPSQAKVDGAQALLPEDFVTLMGELQALASATGVEIS